MNWQLKYLLGLVALFGLGGAVCAQIHNFSQYTIEDGLPSNYVYGLVEDDRGYIWAYTEQGIARFDGYEWKSFGLNDGLATLDCYSMCPLADGSFLVGGKGWPSIVKGDSIFKLPLLQGITEDEMRAATLFEGYPPYLRVLKSSKKLQISHVLVGSVKNMKEFKVPAHILFRGVHERVFETREILDSVRASVTTGRLKGPDDAVFSGEVGNHKFVFWDEVSSYFLDGRIRSTKFPKPKENWSFRGLIYLNELQVNVDQKLLVFDSTFSKVKQQKDLASWYEKYDVTRVLRSKNGDLWLGTRSSGVLHVRRESQRVKILSNQKGDVKTIEGVVTLGSQVFVADDHSRLYRIEKEEMVSIELDQYVKNDSRFRFLRQLMPDELYFRRNEMVFTITKDEVKYSDIVSIKNGITLNNCEAGYGKFSNAEELRGIPYFGRRMLIFRADFLAVSEPNYLRVIADNGNCIVSVSSSNAVFDKRLLNQERELHMGRGGVLYRATSTSIDTLWTSDTLSLTAIYTISGDEFFLGTQANGVFYLSVRDGIQLDRLFTSKSVQTVTKDSLGNFWAATYSGIYRFDRAGAVDLHLSQASGLPSSETYDLDFFSDSVAVGTARGLAIFPKSLTSDTSVQVPNRFVQIDQVSVNGKYVSFKDSKVILSPGEDDLGINFSLLHPSSSADITYEVQLEPYNNAPVAQQSRSVRYSKLSPGGYEFSVTATAKDGSVYTLAHPIELIVQEYFYKKWWFQFLCLVVVGASAWLLFRIREKEKFKAATERINNKRRMSELQLEALRSQMNPHFVFNALGSIQYYIQSEEKHLADSYLTKFAQLMRKYLDSSRRSLVTVEEEIQMLTQYMELEQIRYEHSFTFKFVKGEGIEKSDQLPSMILQPLVENAIIHGLAGRDVSGGEIFIHFKEESGRMLVEITDNGIGYENALRSKRRSHRSRATEITNERIEALQNSGNADITLTYDVLDATNTKYPGTKVSISIKLDPDEN